MTEKKSQNKKKAQLKGHESATKEASNRDGSVFLRHSTAFSILVVLAAAIFTYINPKPVVELLDSWIGFSEHWEPLQPQSTVVRLVRVYIPADVQKREAVVAAFMHGWLSYERDAMGDDEYHPIARKGSNLTKAGGIGYTVIDSMDTMQVMGLRDEYDRARFWVANKMSLDCNSSFNTFETTIRVLGGLLSAHHFSDDPLLLQKAVDLADRILPVFNTPSGLPYPQFNLHTREGIPDPDFPGLISISEATTLQLEFRYLSHLTGNDAYWRAVENVMRVVRAATLPHHLASIFVDYMEGHYTPSAIRLGSRGDSYYEYLLKQYLQTNRKEVVYRDMYEGAMDGIHNHLIRQSTNTKMTYTAELIPEQDHNGEISWRLTPKQDHLACFLGGSLMLGAVTTGAVVHPVSVPPLAEELSEVGKRDWKTGIELVKTCMNTHDTATGLSPEVVHFRIPSDGLGDIAQAPSDWYIKGAKKGEFPPYDARYMLRPETVESLFIAFRLTGDPLYREHGWRIFQAIERHCRVPTGGYATVINVDEVPVRLEDKMETFFLSETLKYLYLLFDDTETLPLDKYVFNTEAHPLPMFDPTIRTGFS